MNEFTAFVGIDISKKTFDACLVFGNNPASHHNVFTQSAQGYLEYDAWLKSHLCDADQVLYCMEHTGLYGEGLIQHLVNHNVSLWVEMAIKIKRSMGLQRGGDDKASAKMIATYAMRFADQVKLWKPIDTRLSEIRMFMRQRDRLVTALTQLQVPIKEMQECGNARIARQLHNNQKQVVRQLEKGISKIDEQVNELIKADITIAKKVERITSIKGVGK